MSTDIKNDQEVTKLRQEANQMLYMSEDVAKVTTPEQETRAVEFLAQMKRRWKMIEDKRKQYVQPLKAVIDGLNADFKTILEPLEMVEGIVKKGMTAYRSAEEFKAKEEARKVAELQAAQTVREIQHDGLTDKTLERAQEASKVLAAANVEAPRIVGTQSGSASFRKDWKFEIIDGSKLPDRVTEEVLKLALEKGLYDQVVRRMIKDGDRDIPGVRVWEESTPVIRS